MLYRKYRSQTFEQIFGQEQLVKILRQAVIDQRIAHAYLFAGPRGTGKTSIARILAKAANCLDLQKNGEPCNKCVNCIAINEGRFLDLIEIDAASNRGIDEIRALKEKVGFLPVEGHYKAYIIDEVHMLTTEAFNALLKTLEEPPERVIFILATTEPHKLPLTIISRTQRFDFKFASLDELKAKLEYIVNAEGVKFAPDALDLIVEAGQGSFRDAETILEKVISSAGQKPSKVINRSEVENILGFASSELVDEIFGTLLVGDRTDSLAVLRKVEENAINLAQFVKQLLNRTRVDLISSVTKNDSQKIRKLLLMVKEFNAANNDLKTHPLPILAIEMAIINLTGQSENKVAEPRKSAKKVERVEEVPVTSDSEVEDPKPTKSTTPTIGQEDTVSIEEIEKKWPDLLKAAKKYNHHLLALLLKARIQKFDEGILWLEVPFEFHKKRLQEKDTQKIMNELTNEVYGKNFGLKYVLNKDLKDTKAPKVEISNSNENLVEEVFDGV